jgi:hypothetical protein
MTTQSYIVEADGAIRTGNDQVEIEIDRNTGCFRDVCNKATGLHHLDGTGSWPFGLSLGTSGEPGGTYVEIRTDSPHPQSMCYSVADNADGKTLRMHYDNLLTTKGAPSGIGLVVYVTLRDDADYYVISATLKNNGPYDATNFFSGSGGLVADVSRDRESLAVPTWYGTIWSNPYEFFAERQTFGYPIFGTNCGLFAGWMDLYGEQGGIGIGYLNRQGLTMLLNAQRAGKGLRMNWQLFDARHEEASKRWRAEGGIYPLKAGEEFATDSWILAPHAGDWHRMADIYRTEYEQAFQGDYLDWASTNETAKNIDLAGSYYVRNKGETVSKFSDVPQQVSAVVDHAGVDPKSYLVVILGQNSQWPDCMPSFYPCSPEAGGNEGCKAMMAEFRRMGVDGVLLYGHPFYDHPMALDYVADADTGYAGAFAHLGNVACTNNKSWLDLWRNKYVPGFDEVDASGAYWDQGPVQYWICSRPDHTHGTSSVGVLGGHVRGVLDIIEAFKDGFKNRRPMFWCEASSDIQMRTCDIWDCQNKISDIYVAGGTNREEILRYTFPYRLITDAARDESIGDRNDALINGFILCWAGPGVMSESPAYLAALRQYVAIRRELRQVQAPGYPYGFRDMVGLTVGSPSVKARSYRDDKGITVLYYATAPVETTITVDKAALGFPGAGTETFSVNLAENEAAYRVVMP